MQKVCRNIRFQGNLLFYVITVLIVLTGCVSPASREGMVPVAFEPVKRHSQAISVVVKGGEVSRVDTTAIWGKSELSNATFREALVEAIEKNRIFSRVVANQGADYILTVTIFSTEQPAGGTSLTVSMEAGWTIQRIADGAKIWQESIRSSHTAGYFEAFAFVKRLRLATEGAVRNNISQGLTKLSALAL